MKKKNRINIQAAALVSVLSFSHLLYASNEKMKCSESFGEETTVARTSDDLAKESSQGQTNAALIQQAILQYKSLVLQVTLLKQSSSASSSSIAALNSEIASRKSSLLKAGVKEESLILTQRDREIRSEELDLKIQEAKVKSAAESGQTQVIVNDISFKDWVSDKTVTGNGFNIDFSPDGRFMATNQEIVDLSTGRKIKLELKKIGRVTIYSVRFSPDSKQVATGSLNGMVHLWEIPSGKFIRALEGYSNSVNGLQYSYDGRLLVASNVFHSMKMWEVSSGLDVTDRFPTEVIGNEVKFAPDGPRAFVYIPNGVKIFNPETGVHVGEIMGQRISVASIVFSSNATRIAAFTNNKTIKIWNLLTSKEIDEIELDGHYSQALAAIPKRDSFMVGLSDGSLREHRFSDGKEKGSLFNDRLSILGLSASSDGETVFATWEVGPKNIFGEYNFVTRRWKLK